MRLAGVGLSGQRAASPGGGPLSLEDAPWGGAGWSCLVTPLRKVPPGWELEQRHPTEFRPLWHGPPLLRSLDGLC